MTMREGQYSKDERKRRLWLSSIFKEWAEIAKFGERLKKKEVLDSQREAMLQNIIDSKDIGMINKRKHGCLFDPDGWGLGQAGNDIAQTAYCCCQKPALSQIEQNTQLSLPSFGQVHFLDSKEHAVSEKKRFGTETRIFTEAGWLAGKRPHSSSRRDLST